MKANLIRTEGYRYRKRYIYACTKCGAEYSRCQYNDRISDLCGACKSKLDKEKAKKQLEKRKAKHDAEVRDKAIEEYKELIIARIQSKNRGLYVIEAMEIAEILKGGD